LEEKNEKAYIIETGILEAGRRSQRGNRPSG
jgi:hypothetical protein